MKSQAEQWLLTEKYAGVESEAFHADCARLQAGEPLAYVIGSIPFLNSTIHLDSHPLIPRPETEYWVKQAITEIRKFRDSIPKCTPRVLDLCAGSGCIGVAVAKALSEAYVTFTEIDPELLPTIEKNLTYNVLRSRQDLELDAEKKYKIGHADLFTPQSSSRSRLELGQFDFILTNPPYIDPALDRTESSVKNFEPHQALYGGTDGMELITKIISAAPKHLNPRGQLWIEHEPEQSITIQTLATNVGFTATTHTDQYDAERYSTLMLL